VLWFSLMALYSSAGTKARSKGYSHLEMTYDRAHYTHWLHLSMKGSETQHQYKPASSQVPAAVLGCVYIIVDLGRTSPL
jgi:hypothetical protein